MRLEIRNKLILTLFTISLATAITGGLVWKSNAIISQPNNFSRKFIKVGLERLSIIEKPDNIHSIMGITRNDLYFQTKNPNNLIVTDINLNNLRKLDLGLPIEATNTNGFMSFIDSTNIQTLLGNSHAIISGNFTTKSYVTCNFNKSTFTRAVPISNNSYVLRYIETTNDKTDQQFAKIDCFKDNITVERNISEKKGDAGIATDGILSFDKISSLIVYVFYYRNGFIVLDTNLNLQYRGNTIDKIYSYQTSAGMIHDNVSTQFTTYKPSLFVNKSSYVDNGVLYIYSGIKADNELNQEFRKNSVIDKYDIKTGKYVGSFYLPSYKTNQVEQFKIYRDLLVVLYNDYIIIYRLK